MIKISIADDHHVFVDGIESILNQTNTFEVINKYFDGEQVLNSIFQNTVDILILDISLPKVNGFDVCQALQKAKSNIKVIILSMHDDLSYIRKAVKLGASGYLLKNTSKNELIEAINTVYNGQQFFSKNFIDWMFTPNSVDKKSSTLEPRLTPREKEVLKYISQGFTNLQIASKMFVTVKAIEFHRSSLLSKFGVNNAVVLVQKANEFHLLN
jgi:two-component system, NarL family, response regulator NreC